MEEPAAVMIEDDLAARCLRRDPKALRSVAEEYGPRIYRWAFARTGDRERAGDIVQETLTRFLESIDRFEGRCSLLTWLYTISHNLICTDKRENAAERRACERVANRQAASSENSEVEGALELVRGLSDDLRPVVILYYVEGLTLAEISDILGLPVSTLKWRLFEGRRRLRERIERGREDGGNER